MDYYNITGLKREAEPLQRAVQVTSRSRVAWMHPVCMVLGLRRPEEAQLQEFDDEALLEFGQHVLEDLRRGVHRRSDIQTPWGDTYGRIPNEVSVERVQRVTMALRTSWAFWSRTRCQVEQWWQRLDDGTRGYLRAFVSDPVEFEEPKLKWYMQFLNSLFTSSRAVLLLCMARVTFLLYVAPWGETAPGDYATLRLRAFHVLRDACWSWNMLVRNFWSVACWVKSAYRALVWQNIHLDRAPDDGRRYIYPEDMIDSDEQAADSEDAEFTNSELFDPEEKEDVWQFFKAQPTEWELFNDCYSMDSWTRAHVAMGHHVRGYRSAIGGKPLHISVIQDEATAEVSENDARSCAVQLWPYFFGRKKNVGFNYRETMRSLDRMVCASKQGPVDSWWPKEMSIHRKKEHHNGFRIKAHIEAILCQDWVNRRVRHCRFSAIADVHRVLVPNIIPPQTANPKVRIPLFGSSRPLCGACASFLRASLSAFGADDGILDRIVPDEDRAYAACCMPHGPKQAVLEEVAVKLEYELGDAFTKPLRRSFHLLAKSVDGQVPPSPDPSDSDTESDTSCQSSDSYVSSQGRSDGP